jgi:hypothetical protein
MAISIPLEEVQSLLRSEELGEPQREVARALGWRIVHEEFATPFQRELAYAGLAVGDVYLLLREERDLLVRFAILDLSAPLDPEALQGEFPPGEELDPGEASPIVELHEIGNGFLIRQAIYLSLARRGRDPLLAFLKWRRIPSAARVCRELLRNIERVARPS